MTLTAHQNAQLRRDFSVSQQLKRDFDATMKWAKLSPASERVAWQSAMETGKAIRCYHAIANSLTWEHKRD